MTERAMELIVFAGMEASRLHHGYVAVDHLLLGMVRQGDPLETILSHCGLTPERVRGAVESTFEPEESSTVSNPPLTGWAQDAINFANEEAGRENERGIGPEHILLGIMRQGESPAAQVLLDLNVTLEKLREVIRRYRVTFV